MRVLVPDSGDCESGPSGIQRALTLCGVCDEILIYLFLLGKLCWKEAWLYFRCALSSSKQNQCKKQAPRRFPAAPASFAVTPVLTGHRDAKQCAGFKRWNFEIKKN